eukprot:TRINITY_DN5736_c0_g1_i8.p1 TRINITY_DN5736_c0_g1~~TRINITY_DN5736_c0_g1_i8.p1  ORF type:complete len:218 (-),score=39.55 TRINITY_DN5736_c0_g1_i8:287-940(-)
MRNADKYLKEMYGSNCMDVQMNKCARGKGDVYLKKGGEMSRCKNPLYTGGFDYPYKVRAPWIRAGELAPPGSSSQDAVLQSVGECLASPELWRTDSQAPLDEELRLLENHVLADVCARVLLGNRTSPTNAKRFLGECLVANKWRKKQEATKMDIESRRNTVLVELTKPTMRVHVTQRLKALRIALTPTNMTATLWAAKNKQKKQALLQHRAVDGCLY